MSMTNQEKAHHHLVRMEHWQSVIDDAEERALAMTDPNSPKKLKYQIEVILENNFDYNSAIGSRNFNRDMAQTYALAVIAGI